MFVLSQEQYMEYIKETATLLQEKKDYITKLDADTGDGDHWLNMNIGFQKLVEKFPEWNGLSYTELFEKIAMTMMSAMGGSSGILYGSAYLKASVLLKEAHVMDDEALDRMLSGWSEAIAKRGDVRPGDKTMLDAIHPAALAYHQAFGEGKNSEECLGKMMAAAKQGAENTRNMKAVKGRASYREDKSVGYLDPGAVTMALQIACLGNYIMENCRVS